VASGDRFDGVRAYVRSQLVEPDVASLAVAVAREGEILWEEGFGWADREGRTPATEHTLYSLASVTKAITATAVMVLREQGQLDLDRPANDYLRGRSCGGRAGDAAGATVRRVANHTAGLPLHYHFFPEDEPYPQPPMDETIRRYGNLVSAPGERFQYSNLGYGVLDDVTARRSGVAYADALRREGRRVQLLERPQPVLDGPGLDHLALDAPEDHDLPDGERAAVRCACPLPQVLGRTRESLAGPDVLRVRMGIRRAEHGGGSAETGETTATTEANRMSANARCHRNFSVHLDHVQDHGFAGGPFVGCAGGPLP
jgi:hypothetical protein